MGILVLGSCEKLLNTQPQDFVTPDNYYGTEAELEAALTGIYDNLRSTNLYGNRMMGAYGLEADEGYFWRTSPDTGPKVYNFSSSDFDVNVFWRNLYIGISRANMLLANMNKNPDISIETRNRIRGEALFLRAYYYFLLVQAFGDVPLILEPVESPHDTNVPRTPIVEVYNQVLADMEEAEGLVDEIAELGFGGRVNKSAVRGILARVCLHMAGYPVQDESKYEDAKKWAKMVIDDATSGHELNPSFSEIFINYAQDEYDIKETIWEVEFWGNTSTSYSAAGYVGSISGPLSTNVTTGTAAGQIRVTHKLYHLYSPGDLRRDWAIANFTYNSTGPNGAKTFITATTNASIYNRYPGKYRREYELVIPKSNNMGPMNFPVLRFSDVLLMYAEADNEINGPQPEAIEYVEAVRKRGWSTGIRNVSITSGGSGYTSAPTVVFEGGGGEGAVATATITNGRVTGVTFARDEITGSKIGHSYTSPPTVTFVGGGGSGATATATIHRLEDAEIPAFDKESKESFRLFIQDERARELCFETLRRHDLIRWGIFVTTMRLVASDIDEHNPGAYYAEHYRRVSNTHLLWPIPTYEMTLNRALTQNPGW